MSNVSTKKELLNYLFNDGKTLTVAEARRLFKIDNVSARISELRADGHPIYTAKRNLSNGRQVKFYRYGTPSKRFTKAFKAGNYKAAVKSLYSKAA